MFTSTSTTGRTRTARRRLTTAAITALAAASFAPSAAQAATATSGSLTFNQRTSWIDYLTGTAFYQGNGTATFGGNASGSGTYGVAYSPLHSGSTTYNLASASTGSGVVGFTGTIDYRSASHHIEVDLDDPQITLPSPSSTTASVSFVASYDPIELNLLGLPASTQIDNNTTPTRITLGTVNTTGTFSGTGTTHSWANAPITLTAAGANAFNGGNDGSYAAGDAFGSLSFSATS